MTHEPTLDGLRAIAVLAVVVAHATHLAPGGWAGVDVFFVLSGYLITRLLVAEHEATGRIGLRRFYLRRCLRLMPALAVLLLFQLLHAAAVSGDNRTEVLRSALLAATYTMNWSLVFGWYHYDIIGHTWSLSIEEQFYLLWPAILVVAGGRIRPAWPVGLALLVLAWRTWLVLHGADGYRIYFAFDTHADSLLIGCAAARLLPAGPRPASAGTAMAQRFAILPVAALLVIMHWLPLAGIPLLSAGYPVVGLLVVWIIVAAARDGWLRRVLAHPAMTYTGRISYSWYLWHWPLIRLVQTHRHVSLPEEILVAAATYPVAMASYHFVERPFLRLKSRFAPARTPGPALFVRERVR